MTFQIHECEQGSDEWVAVRVGRVTASNFSKVLAKGEGKVRNEYMRKVAGEILTKKPASSFTNFHTDRGQTMEPEARALYTFATARAVKQVGFISSDYKGCSPDSLVENDGALEIKTAEPHILIEYHERAITDPAWYPPEHRAQCQGVIWIAEREWIDLAIYWPDLPLFKRTLPRDEAYIRTLSEEVDRFHNELQAMVQRIRQL